MQRRLHDPKRGKWQTNRTPLPTRNLMLSLTDIEQAAQRLQGHLLNTPCVASQTLSQLTGAQIYLKFENLQYTASFKERGACVHRQRAARVCCRRRAP